MTENERRELVTAVREVLGTFKDELKEELTAELQTLVLEPMENRLSGRMDNLEAGLSRRMDNLEAGMGEMETRLNGRMDNLEAGMGEMENRLNGRMDNLDTEINSLTNDVVIPFIQSVHDQHEDMVKQLDRLERQVDRNRTRIEQLHLRADRQERILFSITDDIAWIRKRLSGLEHVLGGEIAYDIAQAGLVVAEERSVYEMLHELEERVARLEERTE